MERPIAADGADGIVLARPRVIAEQRALSLVGGAGLYATAAYLLYLFGKYVSNDVGEYVALWHMVRELPFLDAWLAGRFEIGSLFVFWILAQVLSPLATFYFVGLTAFSVKYHLIRKYLHYPVVALAIYVALFLHLHDANQIRAALAGCFLLYALVAPTGGRFFYLILAGIASLFHYSGLMILALYAVRTPFTGFAVIGVASVAWDYLIGGSAALSFAVVFLSKGVGEVNLTSSLFVVQVVIALASAIQWKRFSDAQRRGAYLIMCGALFYVAFIDNPIMAHRLRELSMLGVFPLLFLGDRKARYTFVAIWLGVGYVFVYNLVVVLRELLSAIP